MTSPSPDGADALRRAAAAWHRQYADRFRDWPAVAEQHDAVADVLDALGDAHDHSDE